MFSLVYSRCLSLLQRARKRLQITGQPIIPAPKGDPKAASIMPADLRELDSRSMRNTTALRAQ
jgi:hypothetical protein